MESSTSVGGRRSLTQQQKQHKVSLQKQQQLQQQQNKQQKSYHPHHQEELTSIICPMKNRYSNSPSPPPQPFMHLDQQPSNIVGFKQSGRKTRRYPDDPDSIELCGDEEFVNKNKFKGIERDDDDVRNTLGTIKGGGGQHLIDSIQSTWIKNSQPMEKFESSSASPLHHHQDYSYAYYEPGAAMRHSNIPVPGTSFNQETAGPSRPPPPNSIRALLKTNNRNHQPSSSHARHTYTTRYGTQENIYEEISNDRLRMMTGGHSMISLNQNMVEEEFRRVQSRHRRILGELNLSVEAMLMPTTPPNDSPNEDEEQQQQSQLQQNRHSSNPKKVKEIINSVGPIDDLISPIGSQLIGGADLDSGFSGSSSGASNYIGSLRYHKTVGLSTNRSSAQSGDGPVISGSSGYNNSIRSSQRSHEDPGFLVRSYAGANLRNIIKKSAEDPGPSSSCLPLSINVSSTAQSSTNSQTKLNKISFWRKGWRKFPGFSSTTSVNKAGTDEPKLNSGSWEDPLPLTSTSPTTASLNNSTSARRSETVNSFTRHNINTINLGNLLNNPTVNNHQTNNINNNNSNRRRLEHTPSARTISSEESWCSEAASERELSSGDEDESDRSISSTTARNSQLRSTLSKAKQHLSFDKWRNGNRNSTGEGNGQQMPSQQEPITTPGESPGGRLSRWFSIRRGSTHHYEIGGNRNSIESDDPPLSPLPHQQLQQQALQQKENQTQQQQQAQQQTPRVPSGSKMPQLTESEEDPNNPFNGITVRGNNLLNSRNNSGVSRTIAPTLPPAPAGLSQQQLKRRHIVAAIVHSENSYVATLQRLVNDYKKPLEESSPPILSSNKISTLFHRLPEILQCHNLFRIALFECVRNWDRDEKIGDVFIGSFGKPIVLDIYSGFINNFSSAMELAKMEAKRKSALSDFLKVKQISAHDRLSFFGLMVKPVQRFPQFILFLQDLLKYTPQGHHDRMSLQLALTQLESLAELLNERKREAEQYQAFKEMLGHISGTFNTRSLSSDGNRHRYLLREDNVTQLEFNQAGFIVKSKQRRLLLLNDKVICVSVAPKQSHDFGATEKLSFKWMLPVADVDIVDDSTSATLSRILTAGLNRGGSLKSNSSASGNDSSTAAAITNGADNLCGEMSNLMHDYEVMSRINDLVGLLKGTYKDINLDVTKKILGTIQSSIQKKDEEMAWVDSCCLQLITKNKSGKEESYTFQTENPSVKKEWITELRLAQLALDTNNSPAWEVPEHEQHQRPVTKMPLFVKSQSVYKSQHQTEVRCGCYYTITNNRQTRRNKKQNYVWLCSSDGTSSHVTILQQHHQQAGVLRDIGSFDLVETQITAMEYVKNDIQPDGDMIWMATDNRKINFYNAINPGCDVAFGSCSIPGVATQILHHSDSVIVSLTNGNLLLYKRTPDGSWMYKEPIVINLGNESIPSILSIKSNVYAACGKNIYVLNGYTGEVQKTFDIQHGQHTSVSNPINLMSHSGIGLWISMKNSSFICLYHTETFKHLQDINIASHVLRVTSSQKESSNNNSSVFVTALMACKGLLWVGTNVGIALTIPLPRLEGVPIISGGISISYHAHFGPITFLLPLIPKSYHNNTSCNQILPSATSNNNKLIQGQKSFNESNSKENPEFNISTPSTTTATSAVPSATSTPTSKRDSLTETSLSFDGTPRKRLGKQTSFDFPFNISGKLKSQLTNSPVMLRKKSPMLTKEDSLNSSRISKTLPRGLGSAGFFSTSINSNSSSQGSEPGFCDVYGLYGDLIFVKEDYDHDEGQGNLTDITYEALRRSDPELAAIPAKVSTLDRRLRMKVSRPRSLDLSNWSVESKSSSLYTSSGSEESMAIRHGSLYGRSVSRNSSSASHKTELNNITENNIIENLNSDNLTTTSTPVHSNKLANDLQAYLRTAGGLQPSLHQDHLLNDKSNTATTKPSSNNLFATLKKKNAKLNKNAQPPEICGRRTVISLMGGRGYINWRHVWYSTPVNDKQNKGTSTMLRNPNSNDAHIVIWEKKL